MKSPRIALVLAFLFALASGASQADDIPQIGGVLNIVAAKTVLLVNGVPVVTYAVDETGSGGRGMDLTDWLTNGSNTIKLTVEALNERGKAKLELKNFTSGEALLTLEVTGSGEKQGTIEAKDLPAWSWQRAEPQPGDAPGLADAVAALYGAYETSDFDAVLGICAPFFSDQAVVGGMTAERFTQQAAPMLEAGKLQPMPELTITSHLDGRMFRVVGPDGSPPVNILIEHDGAKGAMRTGEWWSMIGGEWRVVR